MTVLARVRRDPGAALVVLAILVVLALYGATLSRGIVNYDDPLLYRDNWIVQSASWDSLHAIWFELHGPHRVTLSPEYLPVRDMSVMADFAIWGDAWGGFHGTNLVLYILAIAFWFFALVELGIDRTIAGLALLLWAVHPSHAESVAWLSERKGLLGAMFAGACTLGYARFRAGRSIGWLVLAVITAVCAVWSKAHAAFAVAALVGFELVLSAKRASWRRSIAGLGAIAFAACAAFLPVLYLATHANIVGTEVQAPAGRVEMVMGVLGFYMRMGFLAGKNAIAYPLSSHGPAVLDVIVGAFALLGLVVLLMPTKRFDPPAEARAGAAFWLFTWLPVSHVILPLQMIYVADRYLLLPSLGLALIIASTILGLPVNPRTKRLLAGVLVIAAALRTLDAQANWRDNLALWDRAVTSDPDNGEAWSRYVESLDRAGATDAALAALEEGLARSNAPRLVMRKANMQLARGERGAGVATMRAAAEAGEPIAMANLALLLEEDGERAEALEWARRADGIPSAHTHRVHGKIALAAGLPVEAITAFEDAHALEPTGENQYNLALALIASRRPNEALPLLMKCARVRQTAAACQAQLRNYKR